MSDVSSEYKSSNSVFHSSAASPDSTKPFRSSSSPSPARNPDQRHRPLPEQSPFRTYSSMVLSFFQSADSTTTNTSSEPDSSASFSDKDRLFSPQNPKHKSESLQSFDTPLLYLSDSSNPMETPFSDQDIHSTPRSRPRNSEPLSFLSGSPVSPCRSMHNSGGSEGSLQSLDPRLFYDSTKSSSVADESVSHLASPEAVNDQSIHSTPQEEHNISRPRNPEPPSFLSELSISTSRFELPNPNSLSMPCYPPEDPVPLYKPDYESICGQSSVRKVTTYKSKSTLPPVGVTRECIVTVDTTTTNTTGVIPEHLMDPDARKRGLIQVESITTTKSLKRVLDPSQNVWVRVGASGISIYDEASMRRMVMGTDDDDDRDGGVSITGEDVKELFEYGIDVGKKIAALHGIEENEKGEEERLRVDVADEEGREPHGEIPKVAFDAKDGELDEEDRRGVKEEGGELSNEVEDGHVYEDRRTFARMYEDAKARKWNLIQRLAKIVQG